VYGKPTRYYNYRCSKCGFKEGVDEVVVDIAYDWAKKRTKTSDGESIPVLECPMCDNGRMTFICLD
jgi:hypothetical protein